MSFLTDLNRDQMERLRSTVINKYIIGSAPPITVMDLFLTEHCTLRCDYCFVTNKRYKRSSWEILEKAVDFLMKESKDAPRVELVLFGGEPLIEFPLLKRTVEYAEERALALDKKIDFAVTTNGTIMSEEIARFGGRHGFNYLTSVDGNREVHDQHRKTISGKGSWDLIMGKNFDLLKQIQRWVGTRITVNPDTVGKLFVSVETLFGRGFNQFLICPNNGAQWNEEQLDIYYSEMCKVADFYVRMKKNGAPIRISELDKSPDVRLSQRRGIWGCGAGRSRVAISIFGEIYPCARFVGAGPELSIYKLGTLDGGITEIDRRLEFLMDSEELRAECRTCSRKDSCAGGCYPVNFSSHNSLYEHTRMDCFYTNMMISLSKIIESSGVLDLDKRTSSTGFDESEYFRLILCND